MMSLRHKWCVPVIALGLFAAVASAARVQDQSAPAAQVLGTVSALDANAGTITVKEDKTNVETVVSIAQTRSIFRVAPDAKDLKGATRIAASDLAVGDRVSVRGSKSPDGNQMVARSVVLMSAQDLAQKHEQEIAAWQNAAVGSVTAVDPAGQSVTMSTRTPEGPKSVTVKLTAATELTRYSPDAPKTPAKSDLASIQTGDQLHVLGNKSDDGNFIDAQKIYSAPVRTVAATVVSVDPASQKIVVKNLQTKQNVTVALTADSKLRKLPPEMAAMLAHRFNPGATPASPASPNGGGAPNPGGASGASANPSAHQWSGQQGSAPGAPRRAGDLSRMLEHVPEIQISGLQPGNAVVIWGLAGTTPDSINANTILAGVEPVLQAAPQRQGQALNPNWNLDTSVPNQ